MHRDPHATSAHDDPRSDRCGGLSALLAAVSMLGAQSAPDRSKPPASGPVPTLKLPAIQKHTLSNGLPVWMVEMREVPIVNVMLIVKSGGAADPAGKFGAGALHGRDARRGRRHA